MNNILIGGQAGDGIDTMAAIFEKTLNERNYNFFTHRDVMSQVRGGHNFIVIRFACDSVYNHSHKLTGIVALNDETIMLHKKDLDKDGFILCDETSLLNDSRMIKVNFKELAKAINPKVINTIFLAALLKLYDLPTDITIKSLSEKYSDKVLEANLTAIETGYEKVESIKPLACKNKNMKIILDGNQALTLGAISGNLKFYSAYPMSPSTSILEYLLKYKKTFGINVEQAEDEIAVINMAIGASYAGGRSMVATSGGGFSLMVEALGFSGIGEIPLVVVNVQRPGPATGFPTRTEQGDLLFMVHASQGEFPRLVISIKDIKDAFTQGRRALELAEKYQIPVIILSDQFTAESTSTVDIPMIIPTTFYKKDIPGSSEFVVCADSDEHDEHGHITESAYVRNENMQRRMNKLIELEEDLIEPEFYGDENFETLLIGFGSTYNSIKEAVKILNQKEAKYAALLFGDVFPLPTKNLLKYSAQANNIINIEQNYTGQFAQIIKQATDIKMTSSILKYDGRQMTYEDIMEGLE